MHRNCYSLELILSSRMYAHTATRIRDCPRLGLTREHGHEHDHPLPHLPHLTHPPHRPHLTHPTPFYPIPFRNKQIAELHSRGWNKYDLAGLTGGNLLRIMRGAEAVAREMREEGVKPVVDVYGKREDL